jgi:hypothetical protein
MKRIILILLVILNLFVLGLILIKKTENTEHFDVCPYPTCSTMTDEDSPKILYADDGSDSESTITRTNVCENKEKIYIRNGDEIIACEDNEECRDKEICKGFPDENNKQCVKELPDLSADKLEAYQEAYITINPQEPFEGNGISPFDKTNGTGKFKFSFSFMLQNTGDAEPDKKHYVVSSQSKLWSIYYQNKELFLAVNNVTSATEFTEEDRIKLNTDALESYTAYPITIYVTHYKVVINFISSDDKELFLKNKECIAGSQCTQSYIDTSDCINDICLVTSDKYYLGALIEPTIPEPSYTDIFLYDYKIIKNPETEPDSCKNSFYGKDYKNQKKCLSDCNKIDVCSNIECLSDDQCGNDKVTVCEFEPMLGLRHSIDCIQQCIQNVDCTADFCKTQCEECGDDCPWNKKQDTEMYDSQYFDKTGKPSPVLITLNTVSTDGAKAIVKWRPAYPGKLPVKGYISYLYKTFNKAEAVRINKINISNCNEYCEYIIKDLEPNETYTFGIKAYNDIGLGQISNLLTFKASIINVNLDFTMEEDIDDSAIGDFSLECHSDEFETVSATTQSPTEPVAA